MENGNTRKPDYGTFLGIAVAFAGILTGLLLEKGTLQDLTQLTAFLIVVGGTAGAVLISTPSANAIRACRRCRLVFFQEERNYRALLDQILAFSVLARRGGISYIESSADSLADPLFRKGLLLAVDGVDTNEIRRVMQLEMQLEADHAEEDASVFDTAGGYAPTIGIIGAVLGLIQVMKRLDHISEVGGGIAVAFVATVYGVGLANLILLPFAAKIRARARLESEKRELICEGVVAIAEGLNPHLIRARLESFLNDHGGTRPAAGRVPVSQTAGAGSGM